jgi:high-affinity iron transporter
VIRALALLSLALVGCGEGRRTFEEPTELGGRPIPAEVLNRGEFAYMRHCRGCHGQEGRGDGPYAASLSPRPSDLTRGEYRRLGATGGQLPSDEALSRVIREGIEGTPMGPQPLAPEDLEAVVHYVKTLAPAWRAPPAD